MKINPVLLSVLCALLGIGLVVAGILIVHSLAMFMIGLVVLALFCLLVTDGKIL